MRPPTWQLLLAFAIIYLVWGSTFLAIRVGVHDVPPFLLAALRFLIAVILLFGWTQLRGEPSPTVQGRKLRLANARRRNLPRHHFGRAWRVPQLPSCRRLARRLVLPRVSRYRRLTRRLHRLHLAPAS